MWTQYFAEQNNDIMYWTQLCGGHRMCWPQKYDPINDHFDPIIHETGKTFVALFILTYDPY